MFFPVVDTPCNRKISWGTYALVVLNAAAFVVQAVRGEPQKVVEQYGLKTDSFWGWPLLTHLFMHANFVHIAGNMIYLWFFGRNVERRLGTLLFLAVYVLCGLASAGGMWLFSPPSKEPMVGASGAVFGILGCYLVLFWKRRIGLFYFVAFSYGLVWISALWILSVFFAADLISAVIVSSHDNVAHWGHVGGGVFGLLGTVFLFRFLGYPGHPDQSAQMPEESDTSFDLRAEDDRYASELADARRCSLVLDTYSRLEPGVAMALAREFSDDLSFRMPSGRGILLENMTLTAARRYTEFLKTRNIGAYGVQRDGDDRIPTVVFLTGVHVEERHADLEDVADEVYRYPGETPLALHVTFVGGATPEAVMDLIHPQLRVSHRLTREHYRNGIPGTEGPQWNELARKLVQNLAEGFRKLRLSAAARKFLEGEVWPGAIFKDMNDSNEYLRWAVLLESAREGNLKT